MNRRTSFAIRTVFLVCLAIAGILSPGKAQAAHCFAAGQPITFNVTFSADITDCADHGLEVGKAGITINLNGHTLDGDNDTEDYGIYNPGFDDVTINGPGTIQQFGGGIRIEDANGNKVLNGLTVTDNRGHGVAYTSTNVNGVRKGITVDGNDITLNDGTGLILYRGSVKAKVNDNDVSNNGGDGIFLGGAGENNDLDGVNIPVDEDDRTTKVAEAKITNNEVTENDGTGIAIDATGKRSVELDSDDDEDDASGGSENTISGNNASDNGAGDAGVGHDSRGDNDQGGHGIKVAGNLSLTKITNNTANGNGDPTDGACSSRNGAGIFVAGFQKGVTISGNETDGNAMSGVFTAGTLKKIKVQDNPSITDNMENCDGGNGAIKVSGRSKGVSILRNADISGNDSSGIFVTGHKSGVKINENIVTNNSGTGANFCCDPKDSAAITVRGRSLNLQIVGNTASGQTDSGTTGGGDGCSDSGPFNTERDCVGQGIMIEGSVRKVGKTVKQAVLVQDNTAENNEGRGIGVFVQQSKPIDNSDPTKDAPNNEDDSTQNKTSGIRVLGNDANNNGTDGIFAIADLTLANNIANNNTDFGIEHSDDPTDQPRNADAADGPHLLKDGGGNSASGNGTDCSAGLTC